MSASPTTTPRVITPASTTPRTPITRKKTMDSSKIEGLSRKQREDMDRQQLLREGALKFKAMALGISIRELMRMEALEHAKDVQKSLELADAGRSVLLDALCADTSLHSEQKPLKTVKTCRDVRRTSMVETASWKKAHELEEAAAGAGSTTGAHPPVRLSAATTVSNTSIDTLPISPKSIGSSVGVTDHHFSDGSRGGSAGAGLRTALRSAASARRSAAPEHEAASAGLRPALRSAASARRLAVPDRESTSAGSRTATSNPASARRSTVPDHGAGGQSSISRAVAAARESVRASEEAASVPTPPKDSKSSSTAARPGRRASHVQKTAKGTDISPSVDPVSVSSATSSGFAPRQDSPDTEVGIPVVPMRPVDEPKANGWLHIFNVFGRGRRKSSVATMEMVPPLPLLVGAAGASAAKAVVDTYASPQQPRVDEVGAYTDGSLTFSKAHSALPQALAAAYAQGYLSTGPLVITWLAALEMSQYSELLQRHGYDSLGRLLLVDETTLDRIAPGMPEGHKRHILQALVLLNRDLVTRMSTAGLHQLAMLPPGSLLHQLPGQETSPSGEFLPQPAVLVPASAIQGHCGDSNDSPLLSYSPAMPTDVNEACNRDDVTCLPLPSVEPAVSTPVSGGRWDDLEGLPSEAIGVAEGTTSRTETYTAQVTTDSDGNGVHS